MMRKRKSNGDRVWVATLNYLVSKIKTLHRAGIEPGPPAWQASILPLNHRCYEYGSLFRRHTIPAAMFTRSLLSERLIRNWLSENENINLTTFCPKRKSRAAIVSSDLRLFLTILLFCNRLPNNCSLLFLLIGIG